jgi:hypothetical protein
MRFVVALKVLCVSTSIFVVGVIAGNADEGRRPYTYKHPKEEARQSSSGVPGQARPKPDAGNPKSPLPRERPKPRPLPKLPVTPRPEVVPMKPWTIPYRPDQQGGHPSQSVEPSRPQFRIPRNLERIAGKPKPLPQPKLNGAVEW